MDETYEPPERKERKPRTRRDIEIISYPEGQEQYDEGRGEVDIGMGGDILSVAGEAPVEVKEEPIIEPMAKVKLEPIIEPNTILLIIIFKSSLQ